MARCHTFYKRHKTRHWNTYKEKKYGKSYPILPKENLSNKKENKEDNQDVECLSAFKCIMKGKQTSGAHKPCEILLNQLNK
jgi:hypothetical protein